MKGDLREHVRRDGQAKVAYPTEAIAVARSAGGSERRPYRAYQCSLCLLWHVGRKPATKAQKAASKRRLKRLHHFGGGQDHG